MSDEKLEAEDALENVGFPVTRSSSFAYFHADAASAVRLGEALELTFLQHSTILLFQNLTDEDETVPLSKRTAGLDAEQTIVEAGTIRLDKDAAVQTAIALMTAVARSKWMNEERLSNFFDRIVKVSKENESRDT